MIVRAPRDSAARNECQNAYAHQFFSFEQAIEGYSLRFDPDLEDPLSWSGPPSHP